MRVSSVLRVAANQQTTRLVGQPSSARFDLFVSRFVVHEECSRVIRLRPRSGTVYLEGIPLLQVPRESGLSLASRCWQACRCRRKQPTRAFPAAVNGMITY